MSAGQTKSISSEKRENMETLGANVMISIGALITFIGGVIALSDIFGGMIFSLINIFTTKPYIESKGMSDEIKKIGIKVLLLGLSVGSVGILLEMNLADAMKQFFY